MSQLVRAVVRGLRHPAETVKPGVWRLWLRAPRVFDVVSALLQLRDAGRLTAIAAGNADDPFYAKVKAYNAGVTKGKVVTTTRRAESLYQLLTTPARDVRQEKLLIVGPRNVHELFIAWLYGFRWSNIYAIDLYSTRRKITIMNMEATAFRDGVFDAITMANTLAYAKDTFRCLTEMARILKPGGRLVFGSTYFPAGREWPGNLVSGAEIREMLKRLEFRLAAYQAVDKVNSLGGEQTAHIFMVQKADPTRPVFDRVNWL